MKRWVWGVLGMVTWMMISTTVFAGNVGLPCPTVEQGKFKLGFTIGDGERDIKGDDDTDSTSYSMTRYLITGYYGATDRVTVFANLGLAEGSSDDAQVFINKGFGLETKPMVGVGGWVILWF